MDTPLKILVARRQISEAAFSRRAFAEAGVDAPIHFALNGQEVLDYLQGKPPFDDPVQHPLPDLLFLDCPESLEVLEWVRRQSGLKQMLVIVSVAPNRPQDMARACALGANSCVLSTQEAGELVTIVAHLQNYWRSIEASPGNGRASQGHRHFGWAVEQ